MAVFEDLGACDEQDKHSVSACSSLADTKGKKIRRAGGDKCYDSTFKGVKRQRVGVRGVTPDDLIFEDLILELRPEKQEGAAMKTRRGHS